MAGDYRYGWRLWVPRCVALVVVGAVIAWWAVSCEERGDRRDDLKAANKAHLAACEGLLPQKYLAAFVPDGTPVHGEEFGSMLDPRQESRALLDCRLDLGVQVRAEGLLGAPRASADDTYPFPFRLPSGTRGLLADDNGARASLVVECPGGVQGRVRESKDFEVTVDLPTGDDSYGDPSKANRYRVARTAVRVANWVAARQKCGTDPLTTKPSHEAEAVMAGKPSGLCSWLKPGALGIGADDWIRSGDASFYRQQGSCLVRRDSGSSVEGVPVIEAGVESRSGLFLADGEREYRKAVAELAFRHREQVPGLTPGQIVFSSESRLELWARSVCDGGTAYHRAALRPDFTLGSEDGYGDEAYVFEKGERKKLSTQVRALLDRYLTADGGWAKKAHCRDTEILQEAESWDS
ncbi:hypothetical protein [Streptomyces sp. NBC_01304]|uniref:hypothetical protein n=1 Tax=Streptomyces sp. NBC_01304 TaxID=2903818 RepID=UPI002E0FF643|nr:hypothetical protein OG430_17035 [Streptomyces sp. NBC_01304]